MPSLRKIALHAVPLIRRYGCPCDAQRPGGIVKSYSAIIPMRTKTTSNRIALPHPHYSAGVPFMPDDVHSGHITNTIEIECFQRTPITTTVTALYPTYAYWHLPLL